MPSAVEYLARRSRELDSELPRDCVDEVCTIARMLAENEERPWVGRIRDVRVDERGTFVGPLYPQRFAGRGAAAWTTHYVCCDGTLAYEPILGEPCPIEECAQRLFGKELRIETVITADELWRGFLAGDLEATIRSAIRK